jgi:drug/metabolite transporter (DMT)-like permease
MDEILKIVPVLLYMFVGMISMVMAVKNLTSVRFLPFHEKAANKRWDEIDDRFKLVILTFMRLTGLGFLILSILLLVFPIINYFNPNKFYKYSIPVLALIYCSGLFVVNYLLYRNTSAVTPWKGSLYAMLAIIAGIIISVLI